MVTVTINEAVRRAMDPFGMDGNHTAAMRPSAADFLDRLEEQGYTVVPIESAQWLLDQVAALRETEKSLAQGSLLDAIRERDPDYLSEAEQRVLDGNR
jgi:hypothetical protein